MTSLPTPSLPSSTGMSRRAVLANATCGFGSLALCDMLQRSALAETSNPLPSPHLPARAKRAIFLFMHGGPSQVDTFDYKPELQKRDGEDLPFAKAANISAKMRLMKSPWKFNRHGECGMTVSELFPEVATCADDLCVIRSMHSKGQSHGQAVSMLHTGSDSLVRPSVGAWLSYGLGCENENLPAFMAISPPTAHGGPRNYGSAFLPACPLKIFSSNPDGWLVDDNRRRGAKVTNTWDLMGLYHVGCLQEAHIELEDLF